MIFLKNDRHLLALLFALTFSGWHCRTKIEENPSAKPDPTRFTMAVMAQGLDEPMEMALIGQNILIIERKGGVKWWSDSTQTLKTIGNIHVFTGIEDGLLGVAADPAFDTNHFVYFYYSPVGKNAVNRLSRMELRGEALLPETEKIILEIPTQRQYCCHSAGYLRFDDRGYLWLSVGDNTNAEETEGHIPIDERPGRVLSDDQATSANSQDLRGKILRIAIHEDGSYSCPDGNLFSQKERDGRPEIYVMGCRNPYRFSVDPKTGSLYWGDIGPDTGVPSREEAGTLSFDEVNRADAPGYYGWPYFLGNNQPFPDYDFATKKEGPFFNPQQPENLSPNNSGLKKLPPAQPAMIWYNDNRSERFPLLGEGGQSAMAGPVYYSDMFPGSKVKLPAYYDKKLFIYDWVRDWFMAVSMDDQGKYTGMEPVFSQFRFSAPVDMQFGADGAVYILEYGTNWFAKNNDARLVRLTYERGNRLPVAEATADKLQGGLPMDVRFSAQGSFDHDSTDVLTYEWYFPDNGNKVPGKQIRHTFQKAGVFPVKLTVRDDKGGRSETVLYITCGNEPPSAVLHIDGNKSFYKKGALPYRFDFKDKETDIDKDFQIQFHYIPQGKDLAYYLTRDISPENAANAKGKLLIESNDCKSCHAESTASVGPTYREIAEKYRGVKGATAQLAQKVISGGTGVWGNKSMSGHPGLSKEDSEAITSWILSLGAGVASLPVEGVLHFDRHKSGEISGAYLLSATCRDKGANGLPPATSYYRQIWYSPRLEAENRDSGTVRMGTYTTVQRTFAFQIKDDQWMMYRQVDLTGIRRFAIQYQTEGKGGTIEIRTDSRDGALIGTVRIPAGIPKDVKTDWQLIHCPVISTTGKHALYFVFKNKAAGQDNLFNVDWVEAGW